MAPRHGWENTVRLGAVRVLLGCWVTLAQPCILGLWLPCSHHCVSFLIASV